VRAAANRCAVPLLALAAVTGCATPRDSAAPCPPSRDWGAHIDVAREGSSRLRLHVRGEVDLPAGVTARLRPGPLDKAMPPTRHFRLEVRHGHGRGQAGRQVIGGDAPSAPVQYREIIITCGGATIGRVDGNNVETAD